MNCFCLFVFLFASLHVAAQRQLVRQSIEDDGRQLVVEFDFEQRGTRRHFHRTFDVQEFSKSQKQALLQHLVDSLQLPREAAEVALLDGPVPTEPDALAAAEPEVPAGRESLPEVPAKAEAPSPRAGYRKAAVLRAAPCPKNRPCPVGCRPAGCRPAEVLVQP